MRSLEFAFLATIFFLFSFAVVVSIGAVGDPMTAMRTLAAAVAA